MELFMLAAMIAGMIAAMLGMIAGIRKIAGFYQYRFQFSIWSGVLLFVLALALLAVAGTAGISAQAVYVLLALAAILAGLTIYNDIRLAGIGWGSTAVGLQIVFAICFVLLILFALIGYVVKKVFHIHSARLNSIFGLGFGIKGELPLLMYFLHL